MSLVMSDDKLNSEKYRKFAWNWFKKNKTGYGYQIYLDFKKINKEAKLWDYQRLLKGIAKLEEHKKIKFDEEEIGKAGVDRKIYKLI